jgi:hypothetical protein
MFKMKLLVVVFVLLFCVNNIYSLKITEPVTQDLTYVKVVDVGLVAPGEQILVSFFQGVNGEYVDIKLSDDSKDVAYLENIRFTKESIFTTINISEKAKGSKNIKIILISENSEKEIFLRTTITNDVVYAYVVENNQKTKTNEITKTPIRIINKANSTKEVIISSNMSKHWFNDKITQIKKILLQPYSVTDITYDFMPKSVGNKTNEIYLFLDASKKIQDVEENTIVLETNFEVVKDLSGIQNTKLSTFSLYGLNVLPIHFFNNFIKSLTKN